MNADHSGYALCRHRQFERIVSDVNEWVLFCRARVYGPHDVLVMVQKFNVGRSEVTRVGSLFLEVSGLNNYRNKLRLVE